MREQILALDDLQRSPVDVSEWNTTVYVRVLTAAEMLRVQSLIADEDIDRAAIVQLCAVDGEGQQLFQLTDVEALRGKNWKALDRIVTAALNLNFTETVEAGKDESDSPTSDFSSN